MASGGSRKPRLNKRRHSAGVSVPSFLQSYSDFPDEEKITELNFQTCYGDSLSEFNFGWDSSLPDYPNSRRSEILAASDDNTRNYVANLRNNFRLNKPRNIDKPSFVNGSPDRTQSPNQKEARSPESSDPVADDKKPEPEQEIKTIGAAGDSAGNVKAKPTVLSQLIESIEKALESGNTLFVRGPIHPLQGNIGLLEMNRRSGYSNDFTTEDYNYMASMHPDFVPPSNPWEEKIIFTYM